MDDEAQSGARKSSVGPASKTPSGREQKLAAALRANLRRRKAPAPDRGPPTGDPET
jgi:hypothetical protein